MTSRLRFAWVGDAPQVVVEARDVGLGYVGHLQPADRRQDEAAEVAAILSGGAWLEADSDMLFVEAVGELRDRERHSTLLSLACRILAVLD
jgi:hypothetical protein